MFQLSQLIVLRLIHACTQRWSQIERSPWLQQKRSVAEDKLKQRRAASRRREPFLPISSARSLTNFKPRISSRLSAHMLGPRQRALSYSRWLCSSRGSDFTATCLHVRGLSVSTVRSAPAEKRKSTGSTNSEANIDVDWPDAWADGRTQRKQTHRRAEPHSFFCNVVHCQRFYVGCSACCGNSKGLTSSNVALLRE